MISVRVYYTCTGRIGTTNALTTYYWQYIRDSEKYIEVKLLLIHCIVLVSVNDQLEIMICVGPSSGRRG